MSSAELSSNYPDDPVNEATRALAAVILAGDDSGPGQSEAIARVNSTLDEKGIPVQVVDRQTAERDWHNEEHIRALKINKLVDMVMLPAVVSRTTKASHLEQVLDVDEKAATALQDSRTIEEKGARHYRQLFILVQRAAKRNRR